MKKRKWKKDHLESIVKDSASIAQVLEKLNLRGGGNHATIKAAIKRFNIDTTHFTGRSWSKGKTALDDPRIGKKDITRFFAENSVVSAGYIKRLIKTHKLLPYRCVCGIENSWQGIPITLQLDHIDGDRKNHKLDNLRFMCPNCHSQTPTYSGKNKKCLGIKRVSDEDMLEAIKNSTNIRQALLSVGLENGRNYVRAKKLKQQLKN